MDPVVIVAAVLLFYLYLWLQEEGDD